MSDIEANEAVEPQLAQELYPNQIFFIVLTVVIGSGIFNDYGSAAKTAGPGGMLIAFFIVALIAVAAMDGLSEMIQLFPTVNPIVELVHEFVDPELARLTGFAYWFAYVSFLNTQISRTASYLDFYVPYRDGWEFGKIVTFYILLPLIIVLLNLAPIKIFGYVESLGGALKLLILAIVIFMCFYIAGESHLDSHFNSAVHSRLEGQDLASGSALCLSIEYIAFSFSGIESVAITTFEAKDATALKFSSKVLPLVVFAIYLLSAISQTLLLNWQTNTCVPSLDDAFGAGRNCTPPSLNSTSSAIIIAAVTNNSVGLARAMNGMFLFCSFSAANSCLYVSSRMLYGIALTSSQRESAWRTTKKVWRFIAYVNSSKVPVCAVLVSALFFVWVPFTQIQDSPTTARLLSWFTNAGSLCVIFVWGTVNLAYIRYFLWFKQFKEGPLQRPQYLRLNRWRREKGCSTFLSRFQPWVAYFAFIGSYIIVFGLASAYLWRPPSELRASSFFQYYTVPILLPVFWALTKFYAFVKRADEHRQDTITATMQQGWEEMRLCKRLPNDFADIKKTIDILTLYLKADQIEYTERLVDGHEMEPLNGTTTDD